MTRPIRFALLTLVSAAALLAVVVAAVLPPSRVETPAPHWAPDGLTVRGAYHVHSVGSDGTATIDGIAAAAARAGLQFVILTDHGDGTRPPTPPSYRSGVLCIDAFEVNTTGGHMAVLGAAPSPYPLAGSAHAVLEDVHRLGGIGIATHPGSPRESLRWTDWEAPIDGLEWLNADSEWRDELLGSLGRLLLTYAVRPAESLASLLDRPDDVLRRWDELAGRARVSGLAGADAHARLGARGRAEPFEEGWHLPLPSYEASFSVFALRVRLDARLSGDPHRDARDLIERIRWGRVHTVIDGLATPGAFEFTATSGAQSAHMGDTLEIAGEVRLHARMAAPAGTRLVLIRGGEVLYDTFETEVHVGVGAAPGVYRVELHTPGAPGRPPIPWLVTNPIYVGMRSAHEATALARRRPAAASAEALPMDATAVEVSPGSLSLLLASDGGARTWEFRLADPAAAYAAIRVPTGGLAGRDRLQLAAHANRPMRLWVQLRTAAGERWGQTTYLDADLRLQELFFDRFDPLGPTSTQRPPLEAIDAVLLVIDTLNSRPGDAGRIVVREIRLAGP